MVKEMNVNSITSLSQMAYKTSTLTNYDSSTNQFKVDSVSSSYKFNSASGTSSLISSSSSNSSSYDVTISAKAKRQLAKQQETLQKKMKALENIQTSTTALQDATVTMGNNDYSDADATVKNLKNFIKSYNNNLSTADKNSKTESTATELKVDMQQARYNSRAYAAIGINVSSTGSLSLDENKFRTALSSDQNKVGNTIGGTNGLLAKTAAITDQYLGTVTTVGTYTPVSSSSITASGSNTIASDATYEAADGYESDLVSSLSTLRDSTLTLWNADLELSDDDAIVDAVKDFANDYTGVVNTLASYKNEYYSAESIGLDFAEPRFKSKIYSGIGLNVSSNGSMSVNEDNLRYALTNNRDKVIELLQGDSGLLEKTGGLIGNLIG
jgi:hypothetical protein